MAWNRNEPARRQSDKAASVLKTAGTAKLQNLQILRAIAAFSVVVAHALHETINLAGAASDQAIDAGIWNLGYGVDIFFVLSGFIMMHTTAGEFGKSGASLRFFLRRCARVIPLYWLLTTVLLLGSLVAPSLLSVPIGDASHILASYFFIPDGRGMNEIRPVLALGWTLNYEMLFYFFFALALLLPLRRGALWLSALMVCLAAVGVRIDPEHVQLAFWTNSIILEFLFGVLIALLFRSGRRIGIGITLGLIVIGLLGFFHISAPWNDASLPQFLRYGLPAAAFVLAAAIGPTLPLTRIVVWGVALGDASYSLYLIHPFIVKPTRALWTKFVGDQLPTALLVICSAVASVLFALALYRLVEKPMTAYVQKALHASRRRKDKQLPNARAQDAERN